MSKPPYAKIIERHLEVSKKRGFWSKETKLLKRLMEDYPNVEFWTKTKFKPNLQSFAQLLAEPWITQLKQKYRHFHIPKMIDKEIKINNKKFGKDIVKQIKPESIRKFLNG